MLIVWRCNCISRLVQHGFDIVSGNLSCAEGLHDATSWPSCLGLMDAFQITQALLELLALKGFNAQLSDKAYVRQLSKSGTRISAATAQV